MNTQDLDTGWSGGVYTEGAGQASTGSWELPPPTAMDHGRAATENNLSLAFVGHFHRGQRNGTSVPSLTSKEVEL